MNAEMQAAVLGFDGVVDLIRWAEGRRYCQYTQARSNVAISLDVYAIYDGKAVIDYTLAAVEQWGADGAFRVSVAGKLVDKADRNTSDGMAWERVEPTLESALRVFHRFRGRRAVNGVLIMPSLPEPGWITGD